MAEVSDFFLQRIQILKKMCFFLGGRGVEVAGEGSLGGRGLEFFLGGGGGRRGVWEARVSDFFT